MKDNSWYKINETQGIQYKSTSTFFFKATKGGRAASSHQHNNP